jgi:heme-degrading monooxygenase HmoA
MSVVITCVPVRPDAEPPLPPAAGRELFRAVAADAPFGYLAVGGPAPAALPDGALTGRYEVVHERDTPAPPFEPGAGEPVVFINCMAFEPGREQEAFDFWLRVNDYMVRKPGYRWHRLHRRTDSGAPFGQINVVEWESIESWAAAHDDGFRALTVRPDIPFKPVATLCRPVAERVEA